MPVCVLRQPHSFINDYCYVYINRGASAPTTNLYVVEHAFRWYFSILNSDHPHRRALLPGDLHIQAFKKLRGRSAHSITLTFPTRADSPNAFVGRAGD